MSNQMRVGIGNPYVVKIPLIVPLHPNALHHRKGPVVVVDSKADDLFQLQVLKPKSSSARAASVT